MFIQIFLMRYSSVSRANTTGAKKSHKIPPRKILDGDKNWTLSHSLYKWERLPFDPEPTNKLVHIYKRYP